MNQYYVAYQESNPSSCLNVSEGEEYGAMDEGLDAHLPGGLHPVQAWEIYGERYKLTRKLGYGKDSTVWLADDTRLFYCHA
jgi:hypothetical protein